MRPHSLLASEATEEPPPWSYSGDYSGLEAFIPPVPREARPTVAILTQDIFGPVRNAGIGTAYLHTATFLAERGFPVTIIFTQGRVSQSRTIEYWIDFYRERAIEFICADAGGSVVAPTALLGWSYAGYRTLQALPAFDIVHSSECGASPYYSLLAKRNLREFPDTTFCIKTSSPHLWNREGNEIPISPEHGPIIAAAERYCVEAADLVISPSQHMLNWMKANGYAMPPNICVQPNIMPSSALGDLGTQRGEPRPVDEIVFFGRLEPRKGILLFADALKDISGKVKPGVKVTFLGKTRDDLEFGFEDFLKDLKASVAFEIESKTTFNASQAIEYLKEPGRVAIIPSLLDNSPFTVFEALAHAIPFLASSVGGIPELVHPEDREAMLFRPRPVSLASALTRVLEHGAITGRLSFDPERSLEVWERFHASDLRLSDAPPPPAVASHVPARAMPYAGGIYFPLPVERLKDQLSRLDDEVVFLHDQRLQLSPSQLRAGTDALHAIGCDLAIPVRTGRSPERFASVNFEPSVWTKLEYSRLDTTGVLIRREVAIAVLEELGTHDTVHSTNLDEIVAVALQRQFRVKLLPGVVGDYEGDTEWRFTHTHRQRQVKFLSRSMAPDSANIFRVYSDLHGQRSRIMSAQPILRQLRRLFAILDRLTR